jgi:hypothetical protein
MLQFINTFLKNYEVMAKEKKQAFFLEKSLFFLRKFENFVIKVFLKDNFLTSTWMDMNVLNLDKLECNVDP